MSKAQREVTRGRVLVFMGLMALFSLAAAQVELEARVFEIAERLRCPVCVSESVAQSSSPTSEQMRQIIADKLRAGEGEEEILAFFQARYGDWILLNPPRRGIYLVVWLGPVLVALFGLGLLIYYLKRWHTVAQRPIEADPAYLERVRENLAQNEPHKKF